MIKSMTGFGKKDMMYQGTNYNVEIKTLNHKYLDINTRIPRKFNFLDQSIRSIVKNHIIRGKVDVLVSYEKTDNTTNEIKVDLDLAQKYYDSIKKIEENLGINDGVRAIDISRFDDVLRPENQELEEDEFLKFFNDSLENALNQLITMREIEGMNTEKDLLIRLDKIKDIIEVIEENKLEQVENYRKKLSDRIKELLSDIKLEDQDRINTEVIYFAEKSDISEELLRLDSHINQFKNALLESVAVGRKLDFIIQEMNREVNTIASKSNCTIISNSIVQIKTELEKIREQVQNIE